MWESEFQLAVAPRLHRVAIARPEAVVASWHQDGAARLSVILPRQPEKQKTNGRT